MKTILTPVFLFMKIQITHVTICKTRFVFHNSKYILTNCNQLSWLIHLTSTKCLPYVLLFRIHSYYFAINSSTLDFASK